MEVPASESVPRGSRRHRRRLFSTVDSRFQWKYAVLVTLLTVGIMGVMGSFLYQARLQHSALLALEVHPELLERVSQADRVFLFYLILMIVVVAIAVVLWGLFLTHRISGPLFVVTRHLRTLADGYYPQIRGIRKGDELERFYGAFEVAVESMRKRDLARLERMQASIDEMLRIQQEKDSVDLDSAIDALTKERNALAQVLGDQLGMQG